MIDRKKVIEGLEHCHNRCFCDEGCPYHHILIDPNRGIDECTSQLAQDALELLKLQEPKPVKIIKNAYNHEFYYCPNCDRGFVDTYYKRPLFCDKCGQAVKWDE